MGSKYTKINKQQQQQQQQKKKPNGDKDGYHIIKQSGNDTSESKLTNYTKTVAMS